MKALLVLIITLVFTTAVQAQSEGQMVPVIVLGSDTFITCTLQEVVVVSKRTFKNPIDQAKFYQLKKNVIAVYPYAKEAGEIFRDINAQMAAMDKKKERKRYIKQREDELDQLYSNSLKNLTVTQGAILVKLIARETGQSVYDLIDQFKNPMSAFYWNKLSGFYGYSLKENYDPQEDKDIEMIVRSLEGTL